MDTQKQARACTVPDRVTALFFAAVVVLLVLGSFRMPPLAVLGGALGLQGLAALVYAARWIYPAGRPGRTHPFRLHLPALALIVLPGCLASVHSVRSALVAAGLLVVFFAHFAFLDAFLARDSGWCSPRAFARWVAIGAVLIVVGRLTGRIAGAASAHLAWYNLAPAEGAAVRPFDHLYDFLLVAAFPVVAVMVVGRAGKMCDASGLRGTARSTVLRESCGWRHGVWVVSAGVVALGIVLSFSRAAWIAFGVEALIVAFSLLPRRQAWSAVAALGAVAAALLCIPGVLARALSILDLSQQTNLQRLDQWAVVVELIGSSPLVGHGLGTFGDLYLQARPDASTWYACPHNLYLHIAVECGVPALFVFVAWISDFLRQAPAMRAEVRAGEGGASSLVRYAGFVTMVGVLCYGLFDL